MNCKDCGISVVRTSNSQKRCGDCSAVHGRLSHAQARVRRGERKTAGLGRGGERNGSWKGGKSKKWYKKFRYKDCENCGTDKNLTVHHKDGDHNNGDPENLQTLCRPCHYQSHLSITRICIWCGVEYEPTGTGQKRCPACRWLWRKTYRMFWSKEF